MNKFGSVSWRCRVLGCHATITTTQQGEVLRLGRSGHTHLPNERPPSGYKPENRPTRNDDNIGTKWSVNMAGETKKVTMDTESKKKETDEKYEEFNENAELDKEDANSNLDKAEGKVSKSP